MKKMLLMIFMFSMIFGLSSCGYFREKLLEAPDEMKIPDGSLVAICMVDGVEHKHIYQGDGIYQYFIDEVEQGDAEIDRIQEQAYLHGESVENYLADEYGLNGCSIEDFVEE